MSVVVDPDRWRSAAHRNLIAHLSGPLTAGAVDALLTIPATGVIEVSESTREPLLLIAPRQSLGPRGERVRATRNPGGPDAVTLLLDFAPYTEAGAFLPFDPLPPRAKSDAAAARSPSALRVSLALAEVAADGTEVPVPTADLANRLEVRLLQGFLGRMIYLLGAEKQRLRCLARDLSAQRLLAQARADALDRIGADLAVPRFADEITYDAARKQVVTEVRKDASGRGIAEPDEEYRRRLAIYRRFLLPTPGGLLHLLNGPGEPADPNRGLLSPLGFTRRFSVLEADNEFGVALHLIAAGGAPHRDVFLSHVRAVHLILPANNAAANDVHGKRYLPSHHLRRVDALRERLRQNFQFDATAAIAPMLAAALDRVGRCRTELGGAPAWRVLRTQDSAGGSRYELGLGVDLEPLPASQLDALAAQRSARISALEALLASPTGLDERQREVLGLLRSMKPRPAAEDADGDWLLEPCGLRTVHRINTNRLYLSHLPTFGMAITGPSIVTGATTALEVRYEAPGDPGSNVALATGLQAAAAQWTSSGGPAWTVLSDAEARARWALANSRPVNDPALGVFRSAGLPAITTPAPVTAQLLRVPEELLETIVLAAPQAQRIVAGHPDAVAELRRLVETLRSQGLTSALPLMTSANEVLLVVGVIGLPEAGLNLTERRATGFRWYVVPLEGPGGTIKAVGSRTQFVPSGSGLCALVTLGYARRGQTDPYEYRVELPADARFSLREYEFLMNLLGHAYPLGVEVNTFSLRRHHVDLDGNGVAEPLPPTVARTYRQFRRPRHGGEAGVTLESPLGGRGT